MGKPPSFKPVYCIIMWIHAYLGDNTHSCAHMSSFVVIDILHYKIQIVSVNVL